MSQAALAERLGVSQPLVSAWEFGERQPTAAGFAQLAKVLDLDLAELIELATADETSEVVA